MEGESASRYGVLAAPRIRSLRCSHRPEGIQPIGVFLRGQVNFDGRDDA
jgi:hypothetical protein